MLPTVFGTVLKMLMVTWLTGCLLPLPGPPKQEEKSTGRQHQQKKWQRREISQVGENTFCKLQNMDLRKSKSPRKSTFSLILVRQGS